MISRLVARDELMLSFYNISNEAPDLNITYELYNFNKNSYYLMMKINEPYNSEIKSKPIPENICFELATLNHMSEIIQIMHERNPNDSIEKIKSTTINEIKLNGDDPTYWLYVATVDNQVVGLCRFYHSDSLPEHKKVFPAPEGWYGMGILVSSKLRRNNIARFLTQERIKLLIKLGAESLYSIVDSNNLTSRKMHEEFGFTKIDQANGFLQIDFKNSTAFLYQLKI